MAKEKRIGTDEIILVKLLTIESLFWHAGAIIGILGLALTMLLSFFVIISGESKLIVALAGLMTVFLICLVFFILSLKKIEKIEMERVEIVTTE